MQLPQRLRQLPEWAAPAALIAVSTGLWGWAGARISGPWFIPDEVVYAELGKSLYRLGHFEILGARPDFFSLVYPLFVGLPLHVAGIARGYEIAKGLQALAMSFAVVPMYLWGRSVVSRPGAVAVCALTVALPALALTGFLMTEVLFYPLFCFSAWLMARVLVSPTLGLQALLLVSVLLVALTRLQGVLLAPAFLIAAVIVAGVSRSWWQGLLRLAPTFASLALGSLVWLGIALVSGRRPLGAYQVTAGGSYPASRSLRFVVYHAADLMLLTGVVPVVALVLLTARVLRRQERAPEVVALVAVTIGTTLTIVPFVAVYASGFTGRLAERNLFFLAPLFFLAFVTWLCRGAPRPDVLLGLTAAVLLALVVATPWNRLVVPAAEPDAFTLVPFVDLNSRFPHIHPAVVIDLLAATLVGLLALPRRLLRLIPLLLLALGAGASVSAARYAGSTASAYQRIMVGSDQRWIDEAAPDRVEFLYAGEQSWSGGGPVWTNVFWNDRVERLDLLFGSQVAGPSAAHRDLVAGDGHVFSKQAPTAPRYVVASTAFLLAGTRIAASAAGLSLWRVNRPLRIVTRSAGIDPVSGTLGPRADFVAYGCRGGTADLSLLSPDAREVQIVRAGGPVEKVSLTAGIPWSGKVTVPAPDRPGHEACDLSLRGVAGVRALELTFRGG